jgi:MscS family membrane protein
MLYILDKNIDVPIQKLGIFFIIILSTFIIRYIFLYIIDKKYLPKKMDNEINRMIINAIKYPFGYFMLVHGFYVAIISLQLPDKIGPFEITSIIYDIYILAISFIVLYFAFKTIDIIALYIEQRVKKTDSNLDNQIVSLIIRSIRILVITIGILSILNNFGYNIISLLTGLGLGGLAFALAAQNTLTNVFGSITIFSDKPFRLGDWIKIGDVEGTVEDIAFRTTHIRRFDQALVTVPNSQFVNSYIVNYSTMQKRRIEFYVRISYAAPLFNIKNAINGIRSIIEKDERFDKSCYIVRLAELGEYSLNIYVYCFTKTINWRAHLAIKEDLNLNIIQLLEELDIKIALPSRTMYIDNENFELEI